MTSQTTSFVLTPSHIPTLATKIHDFCLYTLPYGVPGYLFLDFASFTSIKLPWLDTKRRLLGINHEGFHIELLSVLRDFVESMSGDLSGGEEKEQEGIVGCIVRNRDWYGRCLVKEFGNLFSTDDLGVGLIDADNWVISGALAEGSLALPPTSLV
ncbi:Protein of unknown function [Pyronema omphalodes CBS 100304]|uniref:Uncharacterized protein n=1 Tax=Pyronema omphalodes (strain CBS 100304) TaxID=1076935 RepID=U4KTY9_PYROM|nr:Protein of unknown function [Pyronema omphalodes CBS 100304]